MNKCNINNKKNETVHKKEEINALWNSLLLPKRHNGVFWGPRV